MQVRFIHSTIPGSLTENKVYAVHYEWDDYYTVVSDSGTSIAVSKEYFEIVTDFDITKYINSSGTICPYCDSTSIEFQYNNERQTRKAYCKDCNKVWYELIDIRIKSVIDSSGKEWDINGEVQND